MFFMMCFERALPMQSLQRDQSENALTKLKSILQKVKLTRGLVCIALNVQTQKKRVFGVYSEICIINLRSA